MIQARRLLAVLADAALAAGSLGFGVVASGSLAGAELVVCLANKWGLWYGGECAHRPPRYRLLTSSDRCSRS